MDHPVEVLVDFGKDKKLKRFCIILLLFGIIWIVSPRTLWAGLEVRTVKSEGVGETLEKAIFAALDEAIGRVNGRSIESSKQLDFVERSAVLDDQQDYYSSEQYQSRIKSATKGVVDGYEILSEQKDADSLYHVVLSVRITKFSSANSNRKKIAVFPLRIGSGKFQVAGEPVDKNRVARLITQTLVTSLVQSRRFTVLDREYMAEAVDEKAVMLSPDAPTQEMARLGQKLAADYIMVGSVEDLGYTEKKIVMKSSGRELTSRIGYAELTIRLVDSATQQVVFSDFLKLKLDDFSQYEQESGIDAKVAIAAADKVGRSIIETIYPFVVVSVNEDQVTLGQGGSQLEVGDNLDLFMYGKRLTDPYTKEFIGREEIPVGRIKVERVNPKQSYARIVESSVDLGVEFEPNKFICRSPVITAVNQKKELEERKEFNEEGRKKHDEDW